MRNFLIAIMVLAVCALPVWASVNILSDGTNIGPAQDIDVVGAAVTGNGPTKTINTLTETGNKTITGSITATSAEIDGVLTTDGTIYTAKIVSDGAVYPGYSALDPCPGLAAGYIFWSGNKPCFCNSSGVDVSIYDGTTACF